MTQQNSKEQSTTARFSKGGDLTQLTFEEQERFLSLESKAANHYNLTMEGPVVSFDWDEYMEYISLVDKSGAGYKVIPPGFIT